MSVKAIRTKMGKKSHSDLALPMIVDINDSSYISFTIGCRRTRSVVPIKIMACRR